MQPLYFPFTSLSNPGLSWRCWQTTRQCVRTVDDTIVFPSSTQLSSSGIISLQSTEFKRCCFRIIIHFRDSGPIQIVFSTTAWKQLWRGGPIQIVFKITAWKQLWRGGPIQIVFKTTAQKQLWRGGPIQIVGSHMRESFLLGGGGARSTPALPAVYRPPCNSDQCICWE